jgi:hypothetical protein
MSELPKQSHETGSRSLLAFADTLFWCILYLVIAWYFETTRHLFATVLVAPFVLLRSAQSETLGVNWFRDFETRYLTAWQAFDPSSASPWGDPLFWVRLVLATAASGALAYYCVPLQLFGTGNFVSFLWGFILALLITQAGLVLAVGGQLTRRLEAALVYFALLPLALISQTMASSDLAKASPSYS